MIGEHVGKCYYCKKSHDLRIACPEYVATKRKQPIKRSKIKIFLATIFGQGKERCVR